MIKPIFKKGIITGFEIDTFLLSDEIDNYEEIKSVLQSKGYYQTHYFNEIPMFTKNTECKSLGDLINLYKIKFNPRQNKIPYTSKPHIPIKENLNYYRKYDKDKHKELKELYLSYKGEPDILNKQIEICEEMAHMVYMKQNPIVKRANTYYMLPEAAIHYFKTLISLGKKDDQLAITSNYQLSTSSIVVCILSFMRLVSRGNGGVYWNKKYQLLNRHGRALLRDSLKPTDKAKQCHLAIYNEVDPTLASVKDYLKYLDSYYEKLSKVTGDIYPKCSYVISEFGQVFFKVPALVYYEFV